jgi:hypothetical protein
MDRAKRRQRERRLDRRERTISLWLTRLIAFLAVFEGTPVARALQTHIERFLIAITDCVLNFIALRATWSPGYQRRMAQGRAAGCAAAWSGAMRIKASPRALLGGLLRRALKAKTLKGRAEKLLRVLKNRDLWVAHMARRLERGQTRIYSAHSRASNTLPLHRPADAVRSPSPSKLGEELRVIVAPP